MDAAGGRDGGVGLDVEVAFNHADEVIGASSAFTRFVPIAPVASVALGFACGYLAGKGADLLSQKFGWKN